MAKKVVRYLIPAEVDAYISEHGLYEDDGSNPHDKGKGSKSKTTSEPLRA